MTKDEARRQMRSARKAFTGAERDIAQRRARERCLSYLAEVEPVWFLPFVSCGTEIDTRVLIEEVLASFPAISVAVPRVEGKRMQFYRIESTSELQLSSMGIPEPVAGSPVVPEEGIMLLPGLAFDRRGNRAGYGAGYYDYYLAEHADTLQGVLKMGYAFSFQLIPSLECAEHDIPSEVILTESEYYKMNKN